MSVAERLCGLCGVRPDEHRVAVGKVQDEEVYLLLHTAYDSPCLTEVALGLTLPKAVRQSDAQKRPLPAAPPR